MAPCVIDLNTKAGKDAVKTLNLASIRKAIPEEAFVKSAAKSFQYMFRDYACWIASTYALYSLSNSFAWASMPFWQKAVASLVFWNISGFFMWCMFVVGHDCGHTTFSDNQTLNDIVGLFTHGSILVPFHPWQLSHRRHHMYHNHETKDYSHPWYTPERLARPEEGKGRMMHEHTWMRVMFPYIGWPLYLYGMPDGCHFIPFVTDRMWKESTDKEKRECYLSLVTVLAFAGFYIYLFGGLAGFAFYHLAPTIVFGWWLVTVTYLQHHDHKTLVYTDEDWNFVTAAFETIDRTFGFGIDDLTHNITNGHVVHHLFFTKIPHYNLPMATKALKQYLQDNELGFMYKSDDCRDFFFRVHQYFVEFGFKAKRAPRGKKVN
mmetsp:Transcript_28258/g.48445  ORF Transcript_28258/g.48445 Transcript_28258/m.48445 type:complete len:376 (-) Transcript_28258:263-1390(-)|eukprot:CAMPEP_0184993544 /NCGR_PEP_ID=MMETSP1098-20130426/45902_1 /TAXON_ID=89044 /ORGANISM="Spumella elongata, Strain CCAP 955/1" /LENGTH=375 /DNA_ID=CAMNT_0027519403 /DNA_START=83 /DNA_END=1210 /DNA_ORIENTATION=+